MTRPPAPALTAEEARTVAAGEREAMARALWEADHDRTAWEDATEDGPDKYRRLAAAAFAALPPSPAESLLALVAHDLRLHVEEWPLADQFARRVEAIAALASPAPAPQGGLDEIVIDDQCPITGRRCDRPCGAECIRGMFAAPQDDFR